LHVNVLQFVVVFFLHILSNTTYEYMEFAEHKNIQQRTPFKWCIENDATVTFSTRPGLKFVKIWKHAQYTLYPRMQL